MAEATATKEAPAPRYCECYAIPVEGQAHTYEACGREVGKKATFAPGHDAKLKGALIKAHRAGSTYNIMVEGRKTPKQLDALAVAAERGWGKYMTIPAPKPKKERAPKAEKAPKAPKAPKEESVVVEAPKVDLLLQAEENGPQVAVTIGRTTYDGVIVSRSRDGQSVEVEYATKSGESRTRVFPIAQVTELV